MDTRGWSDIAYSFLVHQNGDIYEGRGWGIAGGHTAGYNSVSHAFCLIANTENTTPTDAAIQSLAFLVDEATRRYGPQRVEGHRAVASTACPGSRLFNMLGLVKAGSSFSPSQPAATRTLRVGSTGKDVEVLQTMLNVAVKTDLVVDGNFGPATEAAVKKYQTILKVSADGVWGPASQAAHNALFAFLEGLRNKDTEVARTSTLPSGTRPTLKRGDSGPNVTNLQHSLVYLGNKLTVDGSFGPETENVVKGFQAFFKVDGGADGIVGPSTWDKIDFLTAKLQMEKAVAYAKEQEAKAAEAAAAAAKKAAEQEAIATEKERQEALAAEAKRKADAAAAELEAARAAARTAAMEDLLERDKEASVQAELDRVKAERDGLKESLSEANEELGFLKKLINNFVKALSALNRPASQ